MNALFPALLGPRWNALPPSVRALHGSDAILRAHGRADVGGAGNAFAKVLRSALRLPLAARDTTLEVEIHREGERETWCRRFSGRLFASRLCRSSRWADAFEERIGPLRFAFALEVSASGLHWVPREVRLLALRLPSRWFTGVRASCSERDRRYRFDIDVRMPLVGQLVAYSGWLEIIDAD